MSIIGKVYAEIEKRPQRLRELKGKLGNNKKVAMAVNELLAKKKIYEKNGAYSVKPFEKDVAGAIACTIVKLGGTFGFAEALDGSGDIFVPGRELLGAMTGDEVLVSLFEHPRVAGSREGGVVKITKENNDFVGTVKKENGRLYVAPDATPQLLLPIKKAADGGARDGEKVSAVILDRGQDHASHRVGIAYRFGAADVAAHCAKSIMFAHNIVKRFPEQVKLEAKALENARVGIEEMKGRRDLRGLPIFTIDGADTKDIDDAVSVAKNKDGYELGVHIADVSQYVKPGSALDAEALHRGTSVYYANNVVPMLPRQLSNGICSLNPQEDRLAFSCLMQLDKNGILQDYAFAKTVIRSRVKGVYAEINALLDGTANKETKQKYSDVKDEIPLLREVYGLLKQQHDARGAMEIESSEAKLVMDDEEHCIDVKRIERGESERIIEECMLMANMCAARFGTEHTVPFLYRVHEKPSAEKVDALRETLHAVGLSADWKGTPTTAMLGELLQKTKGTPLETFVHTSVLRSMSKACYDVQEKGHFGLALQDYSHFTSPIRRYPDLAIHRIMSAVLAGEDTKTVQQKYTAFAAEAAQQSSEREVNALQAERSAEDCYKAEYMKQFVGESFDAIVSGVTKFGMYVQLPNTIEGLVRAESMSTGPLTLVDGVSLRAAATGKGWRIGDKVRVTLFDVNVSMGHVDFRLA